MNKVVIITGACSQIGAAIADKFAGNKYNVVINYHTQKLEALKLKEKLENTYQIQANVIKADISKEEEVKKLIDLTIDTFGRIDVLVNNAAVALDNYWLDKTVEEFKKVLDVNLIGTFLCSKYASLKMINGSIINISSTNGIDTPQIYSMDYDASKAAILSLNHNLANILAPNIRVNAVALGWVNTKAVLEMNPNIIQEEKSKILLKRFADPKEAADVVYFLASDEASYINDSIIRVDGGVNRANK